MKHNFQTNQRNLYVLNLPLDVSTDQLQDLFLQEGKVAHAVILATLDSLARRRGFILMSSNAEAQAAMQSLDGYLWHGYRIEVSLAIVQRNGLPDSSTDSEAMDLGPRPTPSKVVLTQQSATLTSSSSQRCQTKSQLFSTCGQAVDNDNASLPAHGNVALVIKELDATIVSSEACVSALTQPFGKTLDIDLTITDSVQGTSCATVLLCCPRSARFARQSLEGLVVGRFRLSTSIA